MVSCYPFLFPIYLFIYYLSPKESPEGRKMMEIRKSLPAFREKENLLKAIAENQVRARSLLHISIVFSLRSVALQNLGDFHILKSIHICLLLCNLCSLTLPNEFSA